MEIRLAICIQHHPARADLLRGLMSSLTPAHVFVAHDPEPEAAAGPWRSYRAALDLAPAWCSHLVIIQDDATVCPGFVAAAKRAIAARPDGFVAFFFADQPLEYRHRLLRAQEQGEAFAEVGARRWVPVVATSWPRRLIAPALEFVDSRKWPAAFRADDEIVGHVARALEVPVYATVPSLVEHKDEVESLIGRRARAGRDRGRVALNYIGDGDAGAIDWGESVRCLPDTSA